MKKMDLLGIIGSPGFSFLLLEDALCNACHEVNYWHSDFQGYGWPWAPTEFQPAWNRP